LQLSKEYQSEITPATANVTSHAFNEQNSHLVDSSSWAKGFALCAKESTLSFGRRGSDVIFGALRRDLIKIPAHSA
jgi:hypothetical protein